MQLSMFNQDWRGAMSENFILKFALLAMIAANFLLVFFMSTQEAIITMVPPQLDGEVKIAQNDASENYKKSYGLFIAQLIGNAKGSNADFIIKALEPMLTSQIIGPMRASLAQQVDEIKKEGLSISFDPNKVSYEKSTQKVFVNGRQTIAGRNGDSVSNARTIEVGVRIENYQPRVFHLDAYNEKPKFDTPNK